MCSTPRGDDHEFALIDPQVSIAQPDQQTALEHEEQLILVSVVVPDKLALELDQLELHVVDLVGDLGAPVVLKRFQLPGDIDRLYHVAIVSVSAPLGSV